MRRTETADGARASTPLRFQGQEDDGETRLFYNRHRYYDTGSGLYLEPYRIHDAHETW
jgi:RHS repeat-associated protein